ncbi:MAG: phosphohydrolase [Verrucomicrobia bacterium]|nr:MAG: phosphohydrolase [Verrucomicrobiota bacterium]
MSKPNYRTAIANYIRTQAQPPDKYSHQPRLYALAKRLAKGRAHDDDVLYAAAWLHDLGVFIGHRPKNLAALAAWDHVAYVERTAPSLLRRFGFPSAKVAAVLEAIRGHLVSANPRSFEGIVLRDADILEQLGAIGALRTICKIGRDTRFVRFADALNLLRRNLEQLPAQLRLPAARRLARPRVKTLRAFLKAAEGEANGNEL